MSTQAESDILLRMLLQENTIATLIQGLTEMLPIASGYHLELAGATNSDALHVVTGLVTTIYSALFQRKALVCLIRSLGRLIKQSIPYLRFMPFVLLGATLCMVTGTLLSAFNLRSFLTSLTSLKVFANFPIVLSEQITLLPLTLLLIIGICQTVSNKKLRYTFLILLGVVLRSFVPGLGLQFATLEVSSLLCGAAALSINGLILFYLESRDRKEEREIESFNVVDLLWSIGGNLIGLIPGASRLGSVYTVLRFRGFKPKPAFTIAVVQGIFTIFASLRSSFTLNFTHLILVITCGVLHCIMMYFILNLNSQKIRQLVMACGIYRVVFGAYLMRHYVTFSLYDHFKNEAPLAEDDLNSEP